MPISLFQEDRFLLLDGALGTMLQRAGLPPGGRPEMFSLDNPDQLVDIHRAYIEAGSDIISANTFGANRLKLQGSGLTVQQAIQAAMYCARRAAEGTAVRVALDIGPLGELLEPGGTLSFEQAYDVYSEVAQAGIEAGCDLIIIETMTDLYETKAALLACVEAANNVPVLVSMTFEENGRTFAGVPVEAFAATIGGLGAAALGMNCSLGPEGLVPLAQRLCEATPLPVFLMPNAGLPNPATGQYHLTNEEFCRQMEPLLDMGVAMVGGCCGTTPETIQMLAEYFKPNAPAKREFVQTSLVCSGTRVQVIDTVCPIGERINPTGKKRLQEALRTGDLAYLQAQAVAQEADGAALLDVNVGAPGVDEVAVLPLAVKAVQAVSGLPLQLDSSNPAALEAALRVYCGKAIVNSTSGEIEKLTAILPLCKRYGAAVVGLTLDEAGIPDTAEGRFAIAQRILNAALSMGIPKEDVYIDCLTLAASAAPGAAKVVLDATRMVKERLGLKTLLGVSNISFGLPARPVVNATFLSMAMEAGLDLPILNPASAEMMGAVASYRMLMGHDKNATAFVAKFGGQDKAPVPAASAGGAAMPLDSAIETGLKAEAAHAARTLVQQGEAGLDIVNSYLMPALDRVGEGFENNRVFLPQLLAAANAAQAAFEVIRASYPEGAASGPPVVIATVKGDVHDIGKNIVRVLLENYGFTVTDLGRDVPPERVVQAAKATGTSLVGLSALMTTTLPAMEETIHALREAGLACKVMVGGAVLTEEFAKHIGAGFYAKDASAAVAYAREIYHI